MKDSLASIVARLAVVGAEPQDSPELRLQKTLLVLGSFMFIAAGAITGFHVGWSMFLGSVTAWMIG